MCCMSTLRSCFEGSLASFSDFLALLSSIFLIISNCSAGVIDLLGAITFGSLERERFIREGAYIRQRDLLLKGPTRQRFIREGDPY